MSANNTKLTLGANDATDSYLTFDGTNLTFYDKTAGAATLNQLISGSPTGNFTISNGKFTWSHAIDE